MNRPGKMAKLQRDMAQLRPRLVRLHGEADTAVRELRELENEVQALMREERFK